MSGKLRRFLVLSLAMCCACGRPGREVPVGSQAPGFELPDVSGRVVRLGDLKGKIVLLDFWATYCDSCQDSVPALKQLRDQYKGKGFELVGISLDDSPAQVARFAKEEGMDYTILVDSDLAVARDYGVRGLPVTLLLDRSGVVRGRWLGFDNTLTGEIRAGIDSIDKTL